MKTLLLLPLAMMACRDREPCTAQNDLTHFERTWAERAPTLTRYQAPMDPSYKVQAGKPYNCGHLRVCVPLSDGTVGAIQYYRDGSARLEEEFRPGRDHYQPALLNTYHLE